MQLSDGMATILVFLALQTGMLIFFCGLVAGSIKDHSRRHDATETDVKALWRTVSKLEGKEEI